MVAVIKDLSIKGAGLRCPEAVAPGRHDRWPTVLLVDEVRKYYVESIRERGKASAGERLDDADRVEEGNGVIATIPRWERHEMSPLKKSVMAASASA